MKYLLALTLLLSTIISNAGADFKVIGYLPSYRMYAVPSIDYKPLTHVMLSFANPDANGNFSFAYDFSALKDSCDNNDVELFISIGGGGLSGNIIEDYYETYTEASERTNFIRKLMDFTRNNGFAGIDVDLEGNLVQMATYDDFVLELKDSLHASGLIISSAKAKWTTQQYVSNDVLNALDFINLMAYDYSGPWTYNNPAPHSSFSDAKNDYNYYANTRNIEDSKLILGLPFYGYQFQPNATSSNDVPAKTWNQIVTQYPNDLNNDLISNEYGDLYYNGKTTIANKVNWAKDQGAGGVMIWELGQDHFGEHSLLKVIDESLRGVLNTEPIVSKGQLNIFPNPSSGQLNFNLVENSTVTITNSIGAVVYQDYLPLGNQSIALNLVSGIYFVQASNGKTIKTQSIIIK